MKGFHGLIAGAVLLFLFPLACSLKGGVRLAPLAPEATRALAEARALERTRPEDWHARAEEALARAARLEPDWVAPRRVEDDLLRDRLRGHEALARRLAELEQAPGDARLLYLVGRLEGQAGSERLVRAAERDPTLSWAHHGVAWSRFTVGRAKSALGEGRRALELARGSHELVSFAVAEARYLLDLERDGAARELLEDVLSDPRLDAADRNEARLWLARAELLADEGATRERGFWRGLALLGAPELGAEDRADLGDELYGSLGRLEIPEARAELGAALGGDLPGSEELRARLFLERGAVGLAEALLARDGAPETLGPLTRLFRIERGEVRAAVDAWLAELPARVKDGDGFPREPALRALVEAARAPDPADSDALGEALLAAGWFGEAQAWAEHQALSRPEPALALERRAAAARALLGEIRGLLEGIDRGARVVVPGPSPAAHELGDLDALLSALQGCFERYHARVGDGPPGDLVRSPRLSFGAVASVVHPGPTFSAADEQAGLGARGAPVPGLAAELARLGRFGIFGQAPGGGGPDGTVLRLVGSEWRTGELLGVPFAGLVAWCEGTDVPSRPARHGAPISGAALHEGFWVDVDAVRREHARVLALEREYVEGAPDELERALAGRGPRVPASAGRDEGARWLSPLGEGERLLLAVVRERARAGVPAGERVTLDELLDDTALHEEGHLTDRTRFLPLSRHWNRALGLALRAGLTPRAIAQELEYRAQLVALCSASEPRLVLADCLGAADDTLGVLPHGDAYRALVLDLMGRAAADLERLSALDPDHYLVHQLHFLGAEDVRRLALEVARQNGMVE